MPVRLGVVTYLNARPCVVGLNRDERFDLRFDVPSRCAELLHSRAIDVGLVPSIEYLRGPAGPGGYCIVPDVAIASSGAVASVAVYTKRPMADVRSIALDTSSRTSAALTRILCRRIWGIDPRFEAAGPDLSEMLERCDAALLIGDAALFLDAGRAEGAAAAAAGAGRRGRPAGPAVLDSIEKIDLGETWTRATGLPFVYAFWAGWPDALTPEAVRTLQAARDAGVAGPEAVAREYVRDPALHATATRYLRDNIRYRLGDAERAGLERFYRYAAELGLAPAPPSLRFYAS